MGKKRNIQSSPIMPGRIKVEIKDEIGNINIQMHVFSLYPKVRSYFTNTHTCIHAYNFISLNISFWILNKL